MTTACPIFCLFISPLRFTTSPKHGVFTVILSGAVRGGPMTAGSIAIFFGYQIVAHPDGNSGAGAARRCGRRA